MIIRNIWAIGRNYADHAKELGNAVPTKPMMFLKAGSSATVNSTEIWLPHWVTDVHHEVELALKFSSHMQILEGAVALDLTERNLQNEAKKAGHPWTLAKSFHNACAVSAFFQIKKLDECRDLHLRLWINDELRQDGRTSQMIFGLESIIEYAKEHFPVCPGDLLLTGTPAGVGPIRAGDRVKAEIEGHITHTWLVQQEAAPAEKS
jgi:2-keto-4-pentenoate hydratase/2-oxohepta-3-ene-1,7-dioic acid hydratase in catechol pathway